MGEIVASFLTEDGWVFSLQRDRPVFQMEFEGEHSVWRCFVQVLEEAEQVLCYSVFPSAASAERRQAVGELLTRLNYGLPIGNFEMDFSDGEIRFKTSLDVEGSSLDAALVRQLLYANVQVMNSGLPAIAGVVAGTSTPEEAARAIED